MKYKTFKFNRNIAVMMFTSVFTFVFIWTNRSASGRLNSILPGQKTIAEAGDQKTNPESKKAAASYKGAKK